MADAASQQAFLAEAQVGILSTVGAKGGPHAVPIWYLYEDSKIRISISRGSQKHKNVERAGRVALTLDRRAATPYYSLTVLAEASIGAGFTDEERMRLATRYLGEEAGKRYASGAGGDSVTIEFGIDRLLEYESPGS